VSRALERLALLSPCAGSPFATKEQFQKDAAQVGIKGRSRMDKGKRVNALSREFWTPEAAHILTPPDPVQESRSMNANQWLTAFAERIGIEPPTQDEFKGDPRPCRRGRPRSERVAAPAACWLSAKAGRSLEESLALARGIAPDAGE